MKMKFKLGDTVSALDDSFNGVVKSFRKNKIIVETSEGFELEFDENELIHSDAENFNTFFTNKSVNAVLKEKEEPKKRSFTKDKRPKKDGFVLEVDLHIEKLVRNKNGMSNYDILTLQTDTAKSQLEFAMRNRMPKVVFIHGVGEGVLKAELDFLLNRYEGVVVQDADYQKYGLGATEVYIKQNQER